MRFWDSSALAPLLIEESNSKSREKQLQDDPEILVWYGTLVELESVLNRRLREGSLSPQEEPLSRRRLDMLSQSWLEVQPTDKVKNRALRLLRVHTLRAADALQLAAALVACEEQTMGFHFLTGDKQLAEAAIKEGFLVS